MKNTGLVVFLDDDTELINYLSEYHYEDELQKNNIDFKYLQSLEENEIVDYSIVFIFLDTSWEKRGGDYALFEEISAIKNYAAKYPDKKIYVYPYSTIYSDFGCFDKLYERLNKDKESNLEIDNEPFILKIRSKYQMTGILAMLIRKKDEV